MCKVIAQSMQSRLLYLPVKFQGLKTNKTIQKKKFTFAKSLSVMSKHQEMIHLRYNGERA